MTDFAKMTDKELNTWLAVRMGFKGLNVLPCGTLKGMTPNTKLPEYVTIDYTRDISAAMGLLKGRYWVLGTSSHNTKTVSCGIYELKLGTPSYHACNNNPARCISEAVAQALESEGGK